MIEGYERLDEPLSNAKIKAVNVHTRGHAERCGSHLRPRSPGLRPRTRTAVVQGPVRSHRPLHGHNSRLAILLPWATSSITLRR